MVMSTIRRQKGWWAVLLLAVLLVMAGCADVKPYQPCNHREEGPKEGLFTGPRGEWVIYRSDAPADDDEKKKKAEQTTAAGRPASDGQQNSKPEAPPESKQP